MKLKLEIKLNKIEFKLEKEIINKYNSYNKIHKVQIIKV
jgi:hypothetical protein